MLPKWSILLVLLGFNTFQKILRLPFEVQFRKRQKNAVKVNQYDALEKVLLYGLSIGLLFFPILWALTNWFLFAERPNSWGWFVSGVVVILFSLVVFWKTHHDLAENWSPTLMVMEEHHLVTTGIYRNVRHPMYLAELLFCVGQILLVPNWFVGSSALFFFLILIGVRIPREERLMIAEFGEAYLTYRKRTGSIFPKTK